MPGQYITLLELVVLLLEQQLTYISYMLLLIDAFVHL